MTKPATSAWSAGDSSARVPNSEANTPPRSMSPTTTTGSPTARASPRLTRSVSRRLISAGLPAPSQIDHVVLGAQLGEAANAASRQVRRHGRGSHACASRPRRGPRTTTWLRRSLPGLSRTGFIRASGSTPAAAACIAWARPISAPSGVTTELLRHVLRLERRHPDAAAGQPATQPGGDHALAGVGGGPGDEQRAPHRRSPARDTAAATAAAVSVTAPDSRAARRMSRASAARPSPSNGRRSATPS